MNHQPFEDWLIEDRRLSREQERDLQAHLRTCSMCSAIAASSLALRSPRWVHPRPGFTGRFSVRLEKVKKLQTVYQAIGTLVLVLGGMALLYELAGTAAGQWLASPAALITNITAYFVIAVSFFHVVGEITGILVRDVPALIPFPGWILMVMSAGAVGAAWVVLVRRLARTPQGA